MEGFKNVNLGNVVSSSKKSGNNTNFVSKEDHEIIKEWNIKSYEVKVLRTDEIFAKGSTCMTAIGISEISS